MMIHRSLRWGMLGSMTAVMITGTGGADGRSLPAAQRNIVVVCAADARFSVGISTGRATLNAGGMRYDLPARPRSIGQRYGSGDVAFALDGPRAVLIGAAGGPYRQCFVRSNAARR
ncbi:MULTISPECIES: hypothetical protein [Bacteria]|uniref:hypothetical protein n=1 Tax=Bacteria TaxID=2 RepID=UPI00105709C4|nr:MULTISPECIES: hypothetical protein [Bacteria]